MSGKIRLCGGNDWDPFGVQPECLGCARYTPNVTPGAGWIDPPNGKGPCLLRLSTEAEEDVAHEVGYMTAMEAVHERIESFAREYAMDTDMDGRDGAYIPTDWERSLLIDAIYALVTDDEFMARFGRFRDVCMEASQ